MDCRVASTWGAWAWVSVRAFPRLWPLVLAYPGALIAADMQTGLLTGALLVLAAHELPRRRVVAGAAVGLLSSRISLSSPRSGSVQAANGGHS